MKTGAGSGQTLDWPVSDFGQFKSLLERYVRKRVSNPTDVEDLVQDIFLKAARTWRGEGAPLNLRAWLFSAARTTVIDHYRKANRALDKLEAEYLMQTDDDDTLHEDLAACLVPLIARLDAKYRDTLMATDIAGETYASAAEKQSVSLAAIKSRVSRGRTMLKIALLRCCFIEIRSGRVIVDWSPRSPSSCEKCRPVDDAANQVAQRRRRALSQSQHSRIAQLVNGSDLALGNLKESVTTCS